MRSHVIHCHWPRADEHRWLFYSVICRALLKQDRPSQVCMQVLDMFQYRVPNTRHSPADMQVAASCSRVAIVGSQTIRTDCRRCCDDSLCGPDKRHATVVRTLVKRTSATALPTKVERQAGGLVSGCPRCHGYGLVQPRQSARLGHVETRPSDVHVQSLAV
jgi:hypothetical protein